MVRIQGDICIRDVCTWIEQLFKNIYSHNGLVHIFKPMLVLPRSWQWRSLGYWHGLSWPWYLNIHQANVTELWPMAQCCGVTLTKVIFSLGHKKWIFSIRNHLNKLNSNPVNPVKHFTHCHGNNNHGDYPRYQCGYRLISIFAHVSIRQALFLLTYIPFTLFTQG